MGAESCNFAPKLPQIKSFSAPNFVFLDDNCPTKKDFQTIFSQPKFFERKKLPLVPSAATPVKLCR